MAKGGGKRTGTPEGNGVLVLSGTERGAETIADIRGFSGD